MNLRVVEGRGKDVGFIGKVMCDVIVHKHVEKIQYEVGTPDSFVAMSASLGCSRDGNARVETVSAIATQEPATAMAQRHFIQTLSKRNVIALAQYLDCEDRPFTKQPDRQSGIRGTKRD